MRMPKISYLKKCSMCKKDNQVEVFYDDFVAFNQGMHAQYAFPYLSSGERELLISGICSPCFDRLFADDDM